MPQIAVAGALAYDQICTTTTGLLNTDQPLLNRKLASVTETFGGCAGNIAFNLGLLGQPARLLSCTGVEDDSRYLAHLQSHAVDIEHCLRLPGQPSARAIIFTDPSGAQFTGFYPGPVPSEAEWHAHLLQAKLHSMRLYLQAPYPPELMLAGLDAMQKINPTTLL